MDEFWLEEDLLPESKSLAEIKKGVKSSDEFDQLSRIHRRIRLHTVRWQFLNREVVKKLATSSPDYRYLLVRVGCEFDPGRKAKTTFDSAKVSVFLRGENGIHPQVYSLFPVEMNSGEPTTISLKFGPSIKFTSGVGLSLGEIGANVSVGQVAPIIRGFSGENERMPYWNLQHHRKAPLYGMRHFWLTLEIPYSLSNCYIGCRVEGYLQTLSGRLLLVPAKRKFVDRPFYKMSFS